jgi:glycosyltransferase involved in cell wall biosynthesis
LLSALGIWQLHPHLAYRIIARVKTSHTPIRALRIALVAPVHGVQPPLAGGSVQLVCRLAERLAARGHEVTVLGSGEPDPPPGAFYDWIDTRRSATSRDDPFLAEALHSVNVDRLLDGSDFDVVHDHTLTGPLLVHRHHATTLHTVYGTVPDSGGFPPSGGVLRLRLIAVSDHQRNQTPNRAWLGTVHPAVPVDAYPFGGARDGSCVVLDELGDAQDTQAAVAAAHRAGRPAVVVGPGGVPGRPQPVDQRLADLLVAGDVLTGPAGATQRIERIAGAHCLVAPLTGPWPFSVALVEALACGTPVVALRSGPAAEIVEHGVTGWLCDHPDQLADAIAEVGGLQPEACRRRALDRFDLPRLVDDLEAAYLAVVPTTQFPGVTLRPALPA